MKKIDEKTVKKFWDDRAKKYGKVSFHAVTTFSEGPEVERRDSLEKQKIRRYLDFSKDRNIIDLGCGIGRIAINLSSYVDFILAIDFACPLVEIGKKEIKKRNIKNVEFLCASSADFKYNKEFDAVVICGLFNNFNDDTFEKTVKNINKHLKKGGKVIAKESVGIGERFEIVDKFSEEIGTKYNSIYRTPQTIIDTFKKYGFENKVSKKLLQHRKETGFWFFVFEKAKNGQSNRNLKRS